MTLLLPPQSASAPGTKLPTEQHESFKIPVMRAWGVHHIPLSSAMQGLHVAIKLEHLWDWRETSKLLPSKPTQQSSNMGFSLQSALLNGVGLDFEETGAANLNDVRLGSCWTGTNAAQTQLDTT